MYWVKSENGNYVDVSKSAIIAKYPQHNKGYTVTAYFQSSSGADNDALSESLKTFKNEEDATNYIEKLIQDMITKTFH